MLIGYPYKFIGKQAFWQNLSLTSLEIPASVLEVDDEAFGGCQNVQTLTLNEGLQTIGAGVFSSCKSLVTVRIPHSVTSVGDSAFDRCSGLDLLIVGDGNIYVLDKMYEFSDISAFLIEKGVKKIENIDEDIVPLYTEAREQRRNIEGNRLAKEREQQERRLKEEAEKRKQKELE